MQQFYDCPLKNIYEYQNDGKIFICGDFNSRCEDMVDFIEGVDKVHERNVVEYNINKYDYLFIDFLLNSNMYKLNGRNCINNDFTCITSNGRSVADYCFEAHEDLSLFSDFNIHKVSDVINEVGHDSILFSSSFPDHSILTLKVVTGQRVSCKSTSDSAELIHKI